MDTSGKVLQGLALALFFFTMRLFNLYPYLLLFHLPGKGEKPELVASIILIYQQEASQEPRIVMGQSYR